MSGTNTKLPKAVEIYLADLQRVRASGGATGERSSYGPLANLLNAVGATLKPKVSCVDELAEQGAGHPDFDLYATKQIQRGQPREGQISERGVVEVKAADDDTWLTVAGDQVSRYWNRYRLVDSAETSIASWRSRAPLPAKSARFDARAVRETLLSRGGPDEGGFIRHAYRPFDNRWL